jgi:hypothetical protein
MRISARNAEPAASLGAEQSDMSYVPRVPWLLVAAVALMIAFLIFRSRDAARGDFNGLDALRDLTERHRALSRHIAHERLRTKALAVPEAGAAERIGELERQRLELGESAQRIQAALVRRGFGVGDFWLPSIQEFEKEALAELGRTEIDRPPPSSRA